MPRIRDIGRIYLIRNILTGKGYVGQTTLTLKARFSAHKYASKYDNNSALHRSMRKHGFDAFSIVELAICPIANLNDLETYFIRYLGTHAKNGIGYNLTDGGNCAKFSEETKNKIRLTRLGKTHSAETKAKIAEARKGKNHSPETLAKMSKSGKSRVLSEESRLQISATLKARHAQKQALALLKIEGDTPCN